jgi:hypothetical protein
MVVAVFDLGWGVMLAGSSKTILDISFFIIEPNLAKQLFLHLPL